MNKLARVLAAAAPLVVLAGPATVPARAAGTGPQSQPGWPLPVDDSLPYGKVMIDRLEVASDGETRMVWDAQAWYGDDYRRLWIETEGASAVDGGGGELENLDLQYSRLVAPFWDLQAGVGYRRLYGPGPDDGQVYGLVGVQGLAPYLFEVDANLRLGSGGDLRADLEAEYDARFTQRLYLQPRLSAAASVKSAPGLEQGAGLNTVALGLRLRYEIRREFAPYVGVEWQRFFGGTRDLVEAAGDARAEVSLVAGVRAWF